jgi:recombination protein RecT
MATTSLEKLKSGGQVATAEASPQAQFSRFLDKFKAQMAIALPKHMNADRMCRLALTQFSKSENLQKSDPTSIAASLMTASTLGLEPGVNGQGFLVPYFHTKRKVHVCEFIPGWKGLVDIANRSGRCTVWSGAVFDGDHFDYALGDSPFVKHRPGDEDDPAKLLFAYAIGRVNGSEWPVVEVWSARKIANHRNKYNKVGNKHYSFRDWEMYARKVPLLQVLKYMPQSIELNNAIAITSAADAGDHAILDGDFVNITEGDRDGQDDGADSGTGNSSSTEAAEQTSQAGSQPATAPQGKTYAKYADEIQNAKDSDAAALILDQARSVLPDEHLRDLAEVNRKRWPL